mmetsp:Transcript_31541/g.30861  ORF Transcript_31541/g.30861 Transcript_31541/m.30861 type:complete len:140 (+) Transcript_31541:153-572(+)
MDSKNIQKREQERETTANQRFKRLEHPVQNQGKFSNRNQMGSVATNTKVDKTKYKTEMCKNWIEQGTCRYGSKCQFAHGNLQLIQKDAPQNNKYKSKLCKQFHEKNFCPYGRRCLFIHEVRSYEEVHQYFYLNLLTDFE